MAEQGNYGTEPSPWSELWGERIVLTTRTSDPSSPTQGDKWLRTDLTSGDKIATLRFEHASGTWDIPVFPTGTSESGVEEVLRIQTPNGLGFVPVVQNGGTRPELAIQHTGARHGWHTSTAPTPDSVVLQYYAPTWDQGDATWTDDMDNADMTLIGDLQAATLSDGNDSIDGDGTDDRGEITLPSQFEGSGLQTFSVEAVIEYTGSGDYAVFVVENSGNSQRIDWLLNFDAAANSDTGNFFFQLTDDAGDRLRWGPTNNPSIDDGSRHNISIIVNDSTQNDVDIIIDGSSVSVTTDVSNGPSSFGTWDTDLPVWARTVDGGSTYDFWFDGEIGAMRWHDVAISSQTIDDYP